MSLVSSGESNPMHGNTYGRWTVVGLAMLEAKSGVRAGRMRLACICRCCCGTQRTVSASDLKNGSSTSCGCLRQDRSSATNRTHGLSGSAEYRVWKAMKDRCLNPRSTGWRYYGARGIGVCESWAESFEAFLSDVGPRPSRRHSIDRIDVDGHYEPSNVRWATASQQRINQRRMSNGQ